MKAAEAAFKDSVDAWEGERTRNGVCGLDPPGASLVSCCARETDIAAMQQKLQCHEWNAVEPSPARI